MKKEIKNAIEDVLDDANVYYRSLDKVLNAHYQTKQWINETIGLDEHNDYRVILPLSNNEESRPLAYALLREIETISNGEYLTLDLQFMWKGKNKLRVTKVIQVMWDRLVDHAVLRHELQPSAFAKCFDTALYSNVREVAIALDYPASKDNLIHRFHVWYGDYIKNGRVAVLSTNPYDYFTMSCHHYKYASFGSCCAIDGEYSNTILTYLNSNCVMIMYTAKPERIEFKEGRCVIYLNERRVFQGRVFGTIYDSDMLLTRDYIQQKIFKDAEPGSLDPVMFGKKSAWAKRKNVRLHDHDMHVQGPVFIDYDYGIMSVRKDANSPVFIESGEEFVPETDSSMNDDYRFNLQAGYCPGCGTLVRHDDRGLGCYDCKPSDNHCVRCGENLTEDDCYSAGDETYCETCYYDIYDRCDKCEGSFLREDMHYMSQGDDSNYESLCDRCFSRVGGYTCWKCGDNYSGNGTEDDNGNVYCESCAVENLDQCEICKTYHADSLNETYDGMMVCGECWRTELFKSADGTERFADMDERDSYDKENAPEPEEEGGEEGEPDEQNEQSGEGGKERGSEGDQCRDQGTCETDGAEGWETAEVDFILAKEDPTWEVISTTASTC